MPELEAFGPDVPPETTRETSVHEATDDQLESIIGAEEREPRQAEQIEPREIEVEEPEPATEEKAAAPEAPPATEQQAEGEVAPEETPEEQPQDDEKEILRLKTVEAEAENKRLSSLLDHHGGKIGFLEQQIKNMSDQPAAPAPPVAQPAGEYGEPYVPHPPPPAPIAQSTQNDDQSAYLVQQAVSLAGAGFNNAHPEVFAVDAEGKPTGQYKPEFMEAMQPSSGRLQGLLTSNDPAYVQQATTQILETSYWNFVKRDAASRREELERRRADQASSFKESKRAAAVTQSSRPAKPQPKAKKLSDVSDEALDSYLDKHFGAGVT